MVFSSPIFLFGFLPLALLFYYAAPRAIKNVVLLSISLFFYAWGEVFYLGVMIISIITNYFVGIFIYYARVSSKKQTLPLQILIAGIGLNLAILISFKYTNFIFENINLFLSYFNFASITLNPIHLPLGISFFTFQAISYIVDVYRKEVQAQKSMLNLALYISLFPQLIAGPIVRYHDISNQIKDRSHSLGIFASGVIKFIHGLAKKMLIANPLGLVTDTVFALPGDELTMPIAWIGILAYTLQIFFDFSGYSDMAIGLGRMFGFRFLENFNYPYISTSLKEFWRRWHISLSTWFRDYVYFSLGGNRVSTLKVYRNLLVVFILTGIWHGASWNFLVWGLFHGFFLTCEHAGYTRLLAKSWRPFQHLYLLLVVIISWVFFRADTLSQALSYLYTMADFYNIQTTPFQYAQVLSNEAIYAFFVGILFCLPSYSWFAQKITVKTTLGPRVVLNISSITIPTILLLLSAFKVASSTYNPFIYFRF